MRHLWFALPVLALACSGDDEPSATTNGGPSTEDTGEGPTTPVLPTLTDTSPVDTGAPPIDLDRYDPEHLTVVEVSLLEDDWDALTQQTRRYIDILLGPDCFSGPPADIFTWFPGDVVVDGESVAEVGLRKKGFIGSMSSTRPSLKVDSDRFVPDQEFIDDTEHFTFNNNNQDVSRIHSCLAYTYFAAAGVPAPRCGLATMRVNDSDLGVYTNVEPIKNAFLRRMFGSDEGELYEGTVTDFAEGLLVTADIKTDGADLAPLQALSDALELGDDVLMAELDPLIDLDGFVRMWVADGLISHWDGYASGRNNFYVYHDPSDSKLRFIVWGADAVFEDPNRDLLFTNGVLAARLWDHPEGQALFQAELQRQLDDVWGEDWLNAEVDRMEALIEPHLLEPAATGLGIDTVRAFVDERHAVAQAFLDGAPPERPFVPPAPIECVDPVGEVAVTFDTEWDTLESDMLAFDGTLEGETYGETFFDSYVGAGAGEDGYGTRLLVVWGANPTFTSFDQVVLLLPEDLEPGTYPVDITGIFGLVIEADPVGERTSLIGGSVTFDAIDDQPGGRVAGTIDGILIPDVFGVL